MTSVHEAGALRATLGRIAGRNRAVIEGVCPEIDCGRYAIKRAAGETITAEADIFAEGHDQISCQLLHRSDQETEWTGVPMQPIGNDRWRAAFSPTNPGRHVYTFEAWVDSRFKTRYTKELPVWVDREKARFSTWYEMFPRSCSAEPGVHGTFRDCERRLPYIASMGFDVLYLPPIHPIARSFRKGRNNSERAEPRDPGSPWGIGAAAGGHKSVHPELGSLDDFRFLAARARDFGIEIALDLALHCAPDHPYVREHPEWFRTRPDGSIQYAENPPKKYQDIYPLNFESPQWRELWEELESVILFWIAEGVRIFRVDNPHTKPFEFWAWVLEEVRGRHPDVLFLSEAFTRPKLMYRLAKLGFSQSYTYFAWRNTKDEITRYFRELLEQEEYFRPNLWPNTPDILTAPLQQAGRPAFLIRLILAATLGANYGIYGPAFELCESEPREPGSEEYLNSEKYELKHWDLHAPWSLRAEIALINGIRRENAALQYDRTLRFHDTDNPSLICYSKTSPGGSNVIATVVNLDPFNKQWGFVTLDLHSLGIDPHRDFRAHDLFSGEEYIWRGSRNYVELTPETRPAHILRLQPAL
jgi:starch synthase (maltosyl-transferring)